MVLRHRLGWETLTDVLAALPDPPPEVDQLRPNKPTGCGRGVLAHQNACDSYAVRYCPNPRCRARALTGVQAEYLDHVATCSDCGAELIEQDGVFVDPVSGQSGSSATVGLAAKWANYEDASSRNPRLKVATGAFCLGAGCLLTIGTWVLALDGGVYFVCVGPIAYGVVLLVQGLSETRP